MQTLLTIHSALAIRQFLEANSTQLTYHGLFSLSVLKPGLYALIRNSHLSVLLVHVLPSGDPSLWTLVTDSNFVNEPAVVWESLEGNNYRIQRVS
jgi:ubiquitin carboxyl-terminal hydrolase MINDY-1/2